MSRAGKMLSVAGIIVALMVALFLIRGSVPSMLSGEGLGTPVARVATRDFLREVRADGVLKARESTILTTPMIQGQGALKISWLAPDGSLVEKGEVVVRFDPTTIEARLLEGEDQAATVDNRMEKSNAESRSSLANLARDATLAGLEMDHATSFQSSDVDIFSRQEIIESEIDLDLASDRMEHSKATRSSMQKLTQVEQQLLALERRKASLMIDNARDGLESLEIRAPHSGIFVLYRQWGEVVRVGEMVWPRRPVAEIPQLEEMQARVYVLEADAGGLEPGQKARISSEALPLQMFPGTVESVAALAMSRNRWSPVQYFEVTLALDSTPPELMRPGARVGATVVLEEETDVLVVPREAIFRDEEGAGYVWLLKGKLFQKQTVETGPAGIGITVILSGLKDGDLVALADPNRNDSSDESPGTNAGPGGAAGMMP
jgi:HlyD family secretion protein